MKTRKESIESYLNLTRDGWKDTGRRQENYHVMQKGNETCLYDYDKHKIVAKYVANKVDVLDGKKPK